MTETPREHEETNITNPVGKVENFVSKHFVRLLVWLAVSGGALAIFGPWLLYVTGLTGETDANLRLHILYVTGGTIAVLGLVETHRKNTTDRIKADADIQNYQASQDHQAKTLAEQARHFTETIAKEREKIETDKAKNEQDHIRQVHAERRSRYTTAIEQLSSDKASIRLGGVYTLVGLVDEWLADDKTIPNIEERRKEGQVIINNLCAYIRSPFLLAERAKQLDAPYAKDLQKDFDGDKEKFDADKQIFKQHKANLEEERQIRQSIIKEIRERLQDIGTPNSWSKFDYNFSNAHYFYVVSFGYSYFSASSKFTGAVFLQDADFSRVKFTERAPFFGATFTERVDFSRVKFTERAPFSGATFPQGVDFSGATFPQGVDFSRATFSWTANFSGAEFNGNADFSGAEFTQNAHFSGAEFTQNAHFSGAEFTQNAHFPETEFNGNADFSEAEFNGNADFSEAELAEASFSGAEFTQNAHFPETEFTGNADFSWAKFTGYANLSETKFTQNAHFSGAEFNGNADFSEAEFNGNAGFSWAEFAEASFSWTEFAEASFSGAEFTGNADFSWAKFTGYANLSETKFTQNAHFSWAEFAEASFSGAEFTGIAHFHKAAFENKPIFEYTLDNKTYKARFSCKVAPGDYNFEVSHISPYKIETEEQEHNSVKFIIPKGTELFDPDDPFV